jgi:hypothetical protein
MKRGVRSEDQGIRLANGEEIKDLEGNPYKYLGVLETSSVHTEQMKNDIRKEYFRRARKVLESKLNARNTVKALNTWAVAIFRYTAGILDWNVEDLKAIDRKTRKLLTMNRMHHPKADIDRLYLPRCEGGRGLIAVEFCVRSEELGLSDYLKSGRINNDGVLDMFLKDARQIELKQQYQQCRMHDWKNKPLHGQYPTRTNDLDIHSWKWLEQGRLKKESEGLIIAAQDQAMMTRNFQKSVMKQQVENKCRMCGSRSETVFHILCECEKMAQLQYKKRHDKVAGLIHWEMCKQFGLPYAKHWYDHRAEPVLENERVKLLWDFSIRTDRVIEARRPDIVVVNKKEKETIILDVAVCGDFQVQDKEIEKMSKYQHLAIEIGRMWDTRVRVIPIVVGALGSKCKVREWLAILGMADHIYDGIQRAALLGSVSILRKVLAIPA